MDSDSKMIVDIVLFSIVFVVIIVMVGNLFVGIGCRKSYQAYQPEYSFITGCRIMVDGKLTPTDIVREMR